MREQIGWQKPTEMPRVIEAMDNCGKLTGGFPSAKKLYPSLAPLVSSDCLYFPKSACPVFLHALLKFLPLHICCCCPREFCQAFQVSIWCCSLLPKHCLGKTMFMHTVQVNTQVGSLKKLQKTFYKLLQKAQRPCHGEEAVCILPRAHRDIPVPKKLWNA